MTMGMFDVVEVDKTLLPIDYPECGKEEFQTKSFNCPNLCHVKITDEGLLQENSYDRWESTTYTGELRFYDRHHEFIGFFVNGAPIYPIIHVGRIK